MTGDILKEALVLKKLYLAWNTSVTLEMDLDITDSREALFLTWVLEFRFWDLTWTWLVAGWEGRERSGKGLFQVSLRGIIWNMQTGNGKSPGHTGWRSQKCMLFRHPYFFSFLDFVTMAWFKMLTVSKRCLFLIVLLQIEGRECRSNITLLGWTWET